MVLENLKFYSDPVSAVDVETPLRYDTDLLLMPSNSPALSAFATDPRWRRVYADEDAVLFARAGTPQAAVTSAREYNPQSTRLTGCAAVLE
jgi:hypothetical protein